MKILISEIPDEGLDIADEENIESDIIHSPVQIQLRVDKVGAEVMIRGNLTAEADLQCSRCACDFHSVLTIPVDAVYHPVEELKGDENHEVASDELNIDFYSGDEFDIHSLINEQVMLALPMKPLCSDICKGICPECGTDLNTGTCTCSTHTVDPRLEVLKKYFPE
jgi:uncharacterized protein